MNHLQLEDLRVAESLEQGDCLAVRGGDAGVEQGIGIGGVGSEVDVTTGGLLFASPVTTVNLVMPVYANTQTATAMDMTNINNTMSMVGSILEGTGIAV